MIHKKDAKDWARAHARGLWTNPPFSFDRDLRVHEAGIRRNVEYAFNVRADGIGIGFSEPWVCSVAERILTMEIAMDAIRGRVPSFVYATDHSVEETINIIRRAAAAGADAAMVWTPYEWAKSQDMACEYYEYVASRVDIAIIAYNTFHSGLFLTPESISRIADIENVCMIKETSSPEHIARVDALCGDRIIVSDNHEYNLLERTLASGQALMLGTTSVFLMQSPHYQPVKEYWLLASQGKREEAIRKYQELEPLRQIWTGMYKTHASVAYIKHWMDINGMWGGPVRPLMKSLTAEEKQQFRKRLEDSGWLARLFPGGAAQAE